MFWGRDINENKINDDKPNATADATTANKNVKNADDFMYDEVYESRNLVETNPMKRKVRTKLISTMTYNSLI